MRPTLLLVAPVRADPDYTSKIDIVRNICNRFGFHYILPELNPQTFDIFYGISVIKSADKIIADLSYARPSCYYELGLIEASGRQATLLAIAGTEIHQHAGHNPVVFFNDLSSYAEQVAKVLEG